MTRPNKPGYESKMADLVGEGARPQVRRTRPNLLDAKLLGTEKVALCCLMVVNTDNTPKNSRTRSILNPRQRDPFYPMGGCAASTPLLRPARRFLNRVHKFDSCRGHKDGSTVANAVADAVLPTW